MGMGYEFLEDTMWTCKEVYEYTIIRNEKPYVWRITPCYGDTIDDNAYEVEFVDVGTGQRLEQKRFDTLIEASTYANHRIQIQDACELKEQTNED